MCAVHLFDNRPWNKTKIVYAYFFYQFKFQGRPFFKNQERLPSIETHLLNKIPLFLSSLFFNYFR